VPVVVGIRARTTQLTSGNLSSNFGFLDPHPPAAVDESTGTDFAGRFSSDGVDVPGVDGGVNAGETRPGNESVRLLSER
jgi:hypothetical protein